MKNNFIVVLGNLPPPMGGAAKNTKLIAEALGGRAETEIINTAVGLAHTRGLLYHFRRATKTATCVSRLIRVTANNKKKKTLYMVPDGGIGMVYTLVYCIFASFLKYKIYLHHRTFLYIDKYNILMFLTRKLLNGKEQHIFLSPKMLHNFEVKYGKVEGRFISDNSRYVAPEVINYTYKSPIILGHLSNLCDEKGFYEVIEVFEQLKLKGIDVHLKIAGKPVSEKIDLRLKELITKWSDFVTYFDHIENVEKDNFYKSLDVFLFPTKFKQEAQPNVIYEAMAKQCICISWGRACIPEMHTSKAGLIVPVDNDYVFDTIKFIENLIKQPEVIEKYKISALEEIKEKKQIAEQQFELMINSLIG